MFHSPELKQPIKSLRIKLPSLSMFFFLLSKYWFPSPAFNTGGQMAMDGPSWSVPFFVCWGLTRLCLWLPTAWAADRGCSLHIWMKVKKDLIQNDLQFYFFYTFSAKVRTTVLTHKGFANIFRNKVRQITGQWRGIKRASIYTWGRDWGRYRWFGSLKDFGSLINNTWIFLAIMTTFIG